MPAARRPSDGDLVLGLDFGTTNSAVAVVQDGVVDVLVNDVGNRLTPSCVHVGADQARQVGEGALRMAVSDPGNTVRNVKRVLGLPVEAVKQASGLLGTVQVGNSNDGSGGAVLVLGDGAGPRLAAEEVVAALLHELKKAAEAQLGRGASGAVIAVPTYFNAAQRHAVRDAGQLAGLEVLRLVNEPTAAAVAYAYDKEFTKTIVVVDVGGGGSSISVLRVESNEITVLASSAARLPGGEDFDQKMVEYLREVIRERHEHTVEDARSLELLRTHWEKAKQRLSRIPVAKIATFLPDAGLEFEHEVKRADMDRCAPLFHEITAAMKSVLEAAKTAPEAVDDVLLVGGSTRIPRLRDLVQEALGGKRLCKAVHQDEEVSKGAALLGAGLCTVRDLTPLHLSVHTNGEEFTVLPNTPLPHTFDLRGQGQGPGQAMVRQGPWVPSGLQGDGDMPMTSIFELTKKSRVAFARLLLDESGLVHLLDACGFLLHVVPRSCLSEQKLRDLQGKHEARQRDQDMEQCRMEEKNALEDKCRTLMAVQVSDDDPDARHILALKQKCQEGLEWLQNNDDAHLQDVKGKLSEIACLEDEVHARQADRRARDSHAREAEIQRVEARESLMELCRDVRDMQVPDGDSGAEALQQECVHILYWLQDNPGVALADIDLKTATVVKKRGDLEEKRAAQERAVRERTAAAPSRSYASAVSHPPRGVRQADQEWPRGSDPKAFHVSGRDNRQGDVEADSTLRAVEAVALEGPDQEQALVLLRDVYRGVFIAEAFRRKSFLTQRSSANAAGPATRWLQEHPDAVLTALAQEAAEEALREARAAGPVVLLVEAVEAGAEAKVALIVRYVQSRAKEQVPVERLLALRDAYSTTGADLLRRLDELGAGPDPRWINLRGISWEEGLGPVSAAGSELLDLLRARAADGGGGGPTRLWASGSSLERLVADACAREHQEAEAFLEDAEAVRELFAGPRFTVLQRCCPAARREHWGTVRGVARELARPGGAQDVFRALVRLRALSCTRRERAVVDDLLDAVQDPTTLTCAKVFDAVFDSLEVARVCWFAEDSAADPGAVGRWLSAGLEAAGAYPASWPRLRYESARLASRLAARLRGTARAAVERIARECAAPLWLRHAVGAPQWTVSKTDRGKTDRDKLTVGDNSKIRGTFKAGRLG